MWDFLKTNRVKIAEQQVLISEQSEKLAKQIAKTQEAEDNLEGLVEQSLEKENTIFSLGKQIDKIQSKKKIEIDEMKADRKLHDQELKHLVKIKTESLEIVHDKKVVELMREKNEEVAKIRDEYRDKIEKNLEGRIDELKEQTDKVMQFIPKVESMVSITQGNQPAPDKD